MKVKFYTQSNLVSDVTASLDLVSLFLIIWEWVKQQHQRVAEAPTSSDSYNTTNLWQPHLHTFPFSRHSITPTKKCHQSSLFVIVMTRSVSGWWPWAPGGRLWSPPADVTTVWRGGCCRLPQSVFLVCCEVNNFEKRKQHRQLRWTDFLKLLSESFIYHWTSMSWYIALWNWYEESLTADSAADH